MDDNDKEVMERVRRVRHAIMKDMFVYTMAMAQIGSTTGPGKGAEKRALRAAHRIDEILKEVYV